MSNEMSATSQKMCVLMMGVSSLSLSTSPYHWHDVDRFADGDFGIPFGQVDDRLQRKHRDREEFLVFLKVGSAHG